MLLALFLSFAKYFRSAVFALRGYRMKLPYKIKRAFDIPLGWFIKKLPPRKLTGAWSRTGADAKNQEDSILCSILLPVSQKCRKKPKNGIATKTKEKALISTDNQLKSRLISWSCWADSNCRPHPYQPFAE